MAKRKKKSGSQWLIWLTLLAALLSSAYLYHRYQQFADAPIAIAESERVLSVRSGDAFSHVLAELRTLGVAQGHDLEWKLLAREMGVSSKLQVGDYTIGNGLTPRLLLLKLHEGKVIQYKFTLVEGWSYIHLRAALRANTELVHQIDDMSDAQVMTALGRDGVHPEGRFLPETYHFTGGTTDLDLLKRAMLSMDAALETAWNSRREGIPIESPEELLTLASIIERETGQPDERPMIAGVFSRRLELGMKLQTDPTVIYGMGDAYKGNIRKKDLLTDTPYNTYTRFGLPPGPIAMPGRAALMAAANPADGDELFFVARGDGSHVFSATLREHNAAVDVYQKRRRAK